MTPVASTSGYTRTAIVLHWLLALAIVATFVLGLYMHELPDSPRRLTLYDYHKWAGISILAISLDSIAGLKKSFSQSKAGDGFPFPIVSNEAMDVFKQYRCFDDFENMPLHGTFLVDGAGLVRWQDISYDPFTQVDFLLAESQRLLKLPAIPTFGASAKKPVGREMKGAERLMLSR